MKKHGKEIAFVLEGIFTCMVSAGKEILKRLLFQDVLRVYLRYV